MWLRIMIVAVVALAACIAADVPADAAISPEKSAVLVATIEEAMPQLLKRAESARERRALKRGLRHLEDVFERGSKEDVQRALTEFEARWPAPGPAVDLVLREARAELL